MNSTKQSLSQSETFFSEHILFQNFVLSSNDAILFLSTDGSIKFANPACTTLFGYSPDELLTTSVSFEQLLPPEFRQEYLRYLNALTGTTLSPEQQFEWTFTKKDGSLAFSETRCIVIPDERGIISGVQFIVRDITKTKLAEQRNEIFIKLGERLSSIVTIEEAAVIVAETADMLFTWDAFTFDLYDARHNVIISVMNIDTIDGKRVNLPPTLTNVPPTHRMQIVLREGGKLLFRTDDKEETSATRFGDITRASESIMIVPIKNNQETVGLVSIQSYKPLLYNTEALGVFQALAEHCGGALERIRTRLELNESEIKYRTLFEHVPDGVYRSTREGNLLEVNQALVDMLGYDSVREFLQLNVANDLYARPQDREKFITIIEANGVIRNEEVVWKHKKGHQIVLLDNAHIVRDANGNTLYYEGTLTDITELKSIERALKESEHKYRVLVERMNEGVIHVDNDDIIQFVNDRYCELVGYAREELIGKCAHELLHDAEGKELVRTKNILRTTGISDKYEIPLKRKNGELITVLISGSPVYNEHGAVIGSIGIHLDVTERKQAEAELARQQAFLRQVIDLNPSFIFAKDRDGRFTLINQAVADTYGTTVEDLIGKRDSDFNSNIDEVEHFQKDDREVIDGLIEKFIPEEPITDSRGSVRWLQTIKRPIINANGKADQLLGVSTDITLRKQVEEALQQSELRFRKIFEDAPLGMAIIGIDLKINDVNQAFCTMLGYTREELIVLPVSHITHPDDYQKDYQAVMKLLNENEYSYVLEKRYIRKDGEIIWGRLTASVIRDIDGRALYGMGMIEDISVRKRTEEMLYLLESAVQQANESIMITDADVSQHGPHLVFVNAAFTRITGYAPEEAIGKTPRILYGQRTERPILETLHTNLSRGEEFHGELTNYKKDGTEFYLEWHIAPIKNRQGEITHFLAVQRDVSSRKLAEKALRKSEKRYRLFFEEDLTGDYIVLPDGTITECNPAFLKIFGFENKQLAMGFNMKNFFTQQEGFQAFVERIRSFRKLEYDELELYRPDGTPVSIIQNVIGIFGKDGELRRFKGYMFDNTERKRLEKQLQHSQKMESIGTLAAGLAHNFNNIMSIILGYASNLKSGSATPSKVAQSADAITLAVKRGTGLVRQLTTFARNSEPTLMSVNPNSVLEEIERIVQETFPENITCSLQLDTNVGSILADPNQLHQALLNLCLNSRDAMPDGGTITLKTMVVKGSSLQERHIEAQNENYICVAVSDTGTGLSDIAREHLYEPFFTTKDIGKGTGLGLSVVYGIVKNHNGFINVESSQGGGTAFYLYFRVQAGIEKFVEEADNDLVDLHGGHETILIVEDEEMLLELVKSLLEAKGYNVLKARDGQEALDLYKQHQHLIALTLSDMGLPKLGGWDLLKAIREITPQATVLLASGYLDSKLRDKMIEGGAADFIQKPYDPEFLLTKIRELIDKKR